LQPDKDLTRLFHRGRVVILPVHQQHGRLNLVEGKDGGVLQVTPEIFPQGAVHIPLARLHIS
jgi:hypothetical protein